MLPEKVVKDSTVLLVYPLHLVDVLGHLLHADEGLDQVLVLVRVGVRQVLRKRENVRITRQSTAAVWGPYKYANIN